MRDAKKKASTEKAQLERDYNSLNHKVREFPHSSIEFKKYVSHAEQNEISQHN